MPPSALRFGPFVLDLDRLRLRGPAGEMEPRPESQPGRAEDDPSDRPFIAVLPFANLSGEAETDSFCDGTTEDIITELSRFSELRVIARHSSFRYKGRPVDLRQVG